MSKIMHCKGCGAKLQVTDPKFMGYALSLENDFLPIMFPFEKLWRKP